MIRAAQLKDMPDIMEIIEDTIQIMGTENNPQWDSEYPVARDFINDMNTKSLFVFEHEDKAAGLICINTVEPQEYSPIHWRRKENAMILHRMAVSPKVRNQGIGSKLILFADEYAVSQNIHYLRTDTFSGNEKMNKAFVKLGYVNVGDMYFRGIEEKFICYDKILK